jgi:hypothetical protein
MNAATLAAQFAAYAWYEDCGPGKQSSSEAARFARANWTLFLPVAHEGWGRLLLRIAKARPTRRRRRGGERTDAGLCRFGRALRLNGCGSARRGPDNAFRPNHPAPWP